MTQLDRPLITILFLALLIGMVLGLLAAVAFRRLLLAQIRTAADMLADPATRQRVTKLRDPGLRRSFARLAAYVAGVESLASIDQLTQVPNRQTALRALADEIKRSSRSGRPLAVAIADIDHFKRVNDTYGHASGDLLLHHVAQLLRTNLRASDVVGRYGGEEFLIVLPETELTDATAACEKLRRLVASEPLTLPDGTSLSMAISLGVAGGAGANLRLEAITTDADSALYAAKSQGRDQVYAFRELDERRTICRSPITPMARQRAMEAGRAAAVASVGSLTDLLGPRPGWAGGPSDLIAGLSIGLARAIGLPDGDVFRIQTASLLHDVGKVAISERLLAKPSHLSPEEWTIVREHPRIGHLVLEQAGAIRDSATIALHHHESWDGSGYPHGLSGTDIPIGARIVAIADAYEAMVAGRPYQAAKTPTQAIDELRRCAGTQFDPELVQAFVVLLAHQSTRSVREGARTGTDG